MQQRRKQNEHGLTLIETMLALTILSVGMTGLASLLITSVAANGRNTTDTRGTMLAQMVMEQIASKPLNTSFTLTDCDPAGATTWTINTASAASPGAGASLDANGNVDFTQSYTTLTTGSPGYAMKYVSCGANGAQVTYDIRWNVRTLNLYAHQVTVAARQIGVTTNGTQLPYFAPPVTLKSVTGQ
jgi:prepilin-type N-terminal cleavage/methylation domain-containing protein